MQENISYIILTFAISTLVIYIINILKENNYSGGKQRFFMAFFVMLTSIILAIALFRYSLSTKNNLQLQLIEQVENQSRRNELLLEEIRSLESSIAFNKYREYRMEYDSINTILIRLKSRNNLSAKELESLRESYVKLKLKSSSFDIKSIIDETTKYRIAKKEYENLLSSLKECLIQNNCDNQKLISNIENLEQLSKEIIKDQE